MTFETISDFLLITIPMIIGGIGLLIRNFITNRIARLETKVDELEQTMATNCVTKDELRQILVDRIEPIREDISDIKGKLDKLYDFLLRQ